jgi:hypothetical protein
LIDIGGAEFILAREILLAFSVRKLLLKAVSDGPKSPVKKIADRSIKIREDAERKERLRLAEEEQLAAIKRRQQRESEGRFEDEYGNPIDSELETVSELLNIVHGDDLDDPHRIANLKNRLNQNLKDQGASRPLSPLEKRKIETNVMLSFEKNKDELILKDEKLGLTQDEIEQSRLELGKSVTKQLVEYVSPAKEKISRIKQEIMKGWRYNEDGSRYIDPVGSSEIGGGGGSGGMSSTMSALSDRLNMMSDGSGVQAGGVGGTAGREASAASYTASGGFGGVGGVGSKKRSTKGSPKTKQILQNVLTSSVSGQVAPTASGVLPIMGTTVTSKIIVDRSYSHEQDGSYSHEQARLYSHVLTTRCCCYVLYQLNGRRVEGSLHDATCRRSMLAFF